MFQRDLTFKLISVVDLVSVQNRNNSDVRVTFRGRGGCLVQRDLRAKAFFKFYAA